MIRITFADRKQKKRALGFLTGRFPFKSWANGEMLVPQDALGALAMEEISYEVLGHRQ